MAATHAARHGLAPPRRTGAGRPEDRGEGARALGASRFDLKYSAGTLRHELMLRSIELYGREVIPRVRQLLTETSAVTVGGDVVGLEAEGHTVTA